VPLTCSNLVTLKPRSLFDLRGDVEDDLASVTTLASDRSVLSKPGAGCGSGRDLSRKRAAGAEHPPLPLASGSRAALALAVVRQLGLLHALDRRRVHLALSEFGELLVGLLLLGQCLS
jgi:hypothetical protein